MIATASTTPSYETLSGIPPIDVAANIQAALANSRSGTGIGAEAVALSFAEGRLSPGEYFYYLLWDILMPLADKKAFVGKVAQHPMHVAAGSREWFATSACQTSRQSPMLTTWPASCATRRSIRCLSNRSPR